MILRILDSFKFSWVLAFLIIFTTPIVKSQIQGCSIDAIELEHCLNQGDRSSFTDECCIALKRVVKGGYNCLCLLVSSSAVPLLNTPISFPLSTCFMVVPPLSQCRVFAPMPVVLPPDIPKEAKQPSSPADVIVPPSPPEMQISSNWTEDSNSTVDRHPDLAPNSVPRLCIEE
ncbi:hypothetical protein HS088_TW01G00164 [Tripterygium wilfordii]|uniref:Bifunctional inhibitor/plant lipid transfer protein/seed storage helical domain-containing protein n=1 Tax=Tripterygium wilfordii TaxID=458696 RepID=A0A7J7E1S7_TRIWF|nr:uncharacterized protein LOC120002306 [Tripterygium wilfordii]KAF5752256.1 hypothetical protein HS088_TW01G00164 [Tripterygium wilfordii]